MQWIMSELVSHLLQNGLPRKCMEWWFSYFSWPIFEFGKATCIHSQIDLTSWHDLAAHAWCLASSSACCGLRNFNPLSRVDANMLPIITCAISPMTHICVKDRCTFKLLFWCVISCLRWPVGSKPCSVLTLYPQKMCSHVAKMHVGNDERHILIGLKLLIFCTLLVVQNSSNIPLWSTHMWECFKCPK